MFLQIHVLSSRRCLTLSYFVLLKIYLNSSYVFMHRDKGSEGVTPIVDGKYYVDMFP